MQMPLTLHLFNQGRFDTDELRAYVAEIGASLMTVREEIRALVGDAESEIFYRAGVRDADNFARVGIANGTLSSGRDGFLRILHEFVCAGLGDFKIVEEEWARGWAVVEATSSFEGRCYARHGCLQALPRCDYVRGGLAAFMQETHRAQQTDIGEIAAVETECVARGDGCCRFLIGTPGRLAECGQDLSSVYTSFQVARLHKHSLTILNEISAYDKEDLSVLLTEALDRILQLLELDAGTFRLLTEDGAGLRLIAHRGFFEPGFQMGHVLRIQGSVAGEAVRTERPMFVENMLDYSPVSRQLAMDSGLRAFAAFPLRSRTRALGVFVVAARGARRFSSLEVEFLTAVSHQIGISIENAQLLESERSHARTLEQAVEAATHASNARNEELQILNTLASTIGGSLDVKTILRETGRKILDLIGYDSLAVYLSDHVQRKAQLAIAMGTGSQLIRRIGTAVDFGKGFAGRISESGESIFANNFAEVAGMLAHPDLIRLNVKTFAAIPLRAHDRVVGVINLSSLQGREIDAAEQRILEAVGNLLGVAIENARLYERTRSRARQERLENALAYQLRRSLDVRHVFTTAVQELCRALRGSRCYIAELEGEETLVVRHEFRRDVVPSVLGKIYPLGDFEPSTVQRLRSGRVIAVEDVKNDPIAAPYYTSHFAPNGVRSILIVPLLVAGQWRAVLVVNQCDRKRCWTKDDLELAQTVADFTALAVENARLFDRTRRSEQEYMTLYDEAPDMYQTVDPSGRIVLCNETEARTLGYRKEALIGKSWIELCTEKARSTVERKLARLAKGGTRSFTLETEVRHSDGTALHVSARAVPIYTDGVYMGARVVMRDITAQKHLERQLIQAQKMESLGTLAGGIAHDFNNLLTGMVGYAALIKQQTLPSDLLYQYADTIERSGHRAADLTRQMLAFARTSPLQPRSVQLNDVILETVTLLSHSLDKRIVMDVCLADDLRMVEADAVQVQQVLLNLCVNARDAMPQGGKLTVRSRNAAPQEVACLGWQDFPPEQCVVVSVIDTGHGMDEETCARIFDPFFTTKEPGKGTGLGLAMVYGLVKQHGGHIEVESEIGIGSTFHLYLPALAESAPQSVETERMTPKKLSGRLLIVDDEPIVRGLLHDTILHHGLTAHVVENGRQAVEFYRSHQDEIDLILMDMMMPEMGGVAAFHHLLAQDPDVRVLLISGYGDDDQMQALLQTGLRGIVRKPCSAEDLLTAIQHALEE